LLGFLKEKLNWQKMPFYVTQKAKIVKNSNPILNKRSLKMKKGSILIKLVKLK